MFVNWFFAVEDAAASQVPDDYQQSDVMAAPTRTTDDGWPFDDGIIGSSIPDDYQQSDVAVAPARMTESGPVFDGGDEDLDELFVDDFANFDPDAIRDDSGLWFIYTSDETHVLVLPDDYQQSNS